MAMYMCDQDNSNVHAVFTTVTCWKDMHIIHACVGIIFILFFLGFCILSTLTCFEGRWVFKKLFFSLILIKFFHQNSTILKNYWFKIIYSLDTWAKKWIVGKIRNHWCYSNCIFSLKSCFFQCSDNENSIIYSFCICSLVRVLISITLFRIEYTIIRTLIDFKWCLERYWCLAIWCLSVRSFYRIICSMGV